MKNNIEKKILITGGFGYIGTCLVDLLLKQKYKVFVVDNLVNGKKFFKKNLTFIKGDYSSKQTAKKIISNYPCVVLGTAHPYKFLETMKLVTGKQIEKPSQVAKLMPGKEKYDILNNNTNMVKKYILEKQYEN